MLCHTLRVLESFKKCEDFVGKVCYTLHYFSTKFNVLLYDVVGTYIILLNNNNTYNNIKIRHFLWLFLYWNLENVKNIVLLMCFLSGLSFPQWFATSSFPISVTISKQWQKLRLGYFYWQVDGIFNIRDN